MVMNENTPRSCFIPKNDYDHRVEMFGRAFWNDLVIRDLLGEEALDAPTFSRPIFRKRRTASARNFQFLSQTNHNLLGTS